MSGKIAGLILFLCASGGLADDGPTILPPRPTPAIPPPVKSTVESSEALPMPRTVAPIVSTLGKPLPLKQAPGPRESGAAPADGAAKSLGRPDAKLNRETEVLKTERENAKTLGRQDVSKLMRETDVLKTEREKLKSERDDSSRPAEKTSPTHAGDVIKLRLRLADLLTKFGTEPPAAEPAPPAKLVPGPRPEVPKTSRSSGIERDKLPGIELPKRPTNEQAPTGQDRPLEPLALAEALFRTGDYEGALTTYRLIDVPTLPKHDRLAVQYLEACCLRKLGKADQAASLYREVANAKDDDVLAECAQWQLSALQWRRELEGHIEQLRQRRQALEIKP